MVETLISLHITHTCTITEKHFQKDKLLTANINKLNTLLDKDKLRNIPSRNG
jgi:hypothetical protein